MEILSYLTELVKTRKEVGVSGLGTFYKKKSPGRYDAGTHSFLPPSFTLDFTQEIREQTALTAFISRRRNISNDAAAYYIEQFAADIQKQLTDAQQADLGELGQLSSVSGELSFTAKSESTFGFDFYGLPNLKDPELIVEKPVDENTPEEAIHQEVTEEQLILEDNNADLSDGSGEFDELHHEEKDFEEEPVISKETDAVTNAPKPDETTVTESVTTDTVTAPYIETVTQPDSIVNYTYAPEPVPLNNYTLTEEEPITESRGMPAYLKVIIALVVVFLLLVAAYCVKPELFNGMINKGIEAQSPSTTESPRIDKLKTDSAALADSIHRSQEKITSPTDTLTDTAIVNTTKITTPIDTAIKYEIIAASLANKKEAEDFLAQMKRNGIPAKVADMPGRRIKISIGTFIDEATAKKELELLKKSTRIPGIYIYPIRHTKKP